MRQWTDSELAVRSAAAERLGATLSQSGGVQIARGPSSTVALLTEQFTPDLDALIAAKAPGHPEAGRPRPPPASTSSTTPPASSRSGRSRAAHSTRRTPTRQCDPKALGTISWSEIGVQGAARPEPPAAAREHRRLALGLGVGPERSVGCVTSSPPTTASSCWPTALQSRAPTFASRVRPQRCCTPPTPARGSPVATPAGVEVQAIAGDNLIGVDGAGGVQTSNDGGTTWNATDANALLPAGSAQGFGVDDSTSVRSGSPRSSRRMRTQRPAVRSVTSCCSAPTASTGTRAISRAAGEPARTEPMQVTVGVRPRGRRLRHGRAPTRAAR